MPTSNRSPTTRRRPARLLAEAGWKPGKDGILEKDGQRFSFTLITNNGNEIRRDIATLVQDDLKKLGIEVKIELYEWAVFLKNFINKGSFDAMVLGWALGPDYDQYQIWHSSQSNPEQLNVVNYRNPKVDGLLEEIRQEYNREKIIALAGDLQTTIYRDQPYLFLYVPQGTSVMWKDSYRIRRPDGRGGWINTPGGNDQSRLGLLHGLVLQAGIRGLAAEMSIGLASSYADLYRSTSADQRGAAFPYQPHFVLYHYADTGKSVSLGRAQSPGSPRRSRRPSRRSSTSIDLCTSNTCSICVIFSAAVSRASKTTAPSFAGSPSDCPATVSLNVLAIFLSLTFGLLLGVYAAKHAGRLPDVLTSILAFVFIALPGFWISDLIVIGLVKFTNAPILGTQTYGIDFPNILSLWLDRFWHLALPAMVLSIGGIAAQSRYIRASMIETLREDYIRTAFAKGLAQEAVFYKHALRNSIRPLITGIGGLLPGLIGGSIIIETIFAYPGLGRLGYEAVLERDYPTLVALNFIVAALVLLGNLLSDVLYAVVDPRVRLE